MSEIKFPGGRSFAFTILDDTDDFEVVSDRPIYDLLSRLGFRTTKTVWVFDTPEGDRGQYRLGDTLQNPDYKAWVHDLSNQGFEIAFHGASMTSSRRPTTEAALSYMDAEFPGSLRVYCNHGENRENLYWGRYRYTWGPTRLLASTLDRLGDRPRMDGHRPGSDFYWADLARERVKYVRSLTFGRLNCAKIPPGGPFHDARRPEIHSWFNTADASAANQFKDLVTRESIDRLEAAGGWSIVSTHLGKGFVCEGQVDPEIEATLEYLASRPGWFVPVGTLLDYLTQVRGETHISFHERVLSELLHVWDRLIRGSSWRP